MFIVVVALLVTGIYWGYGKFQILMKNDDQMKKTINDIPSSAANEIIVPVNKSEKGKIEGTLSYPAAGIPELTVYAYDVLDEKKYFYVETKENQKEFTITNVDPGSYYVVAYAKNYEAVGSYTKAVICGLSVDCNDHQMIDVTVGPGKTAKGAEVTDWYAPQGTFPNKP